MSIEPDKSPRIAGWISLCASGNIVIEFQSQNNEHRGRERTTGPGTVFSAFVHDVIGGHMIHATRTTLVGFFLVLWSLQVTASDLASQPMIGQTAPPFDLAEVGGENIDLADLRGRFVVIHFGTSW
jgi:hypothetical protein